MSDESELSILQHLDELRKRMTRSIIAVVIGVVAGTFLTPTALSFLVAPLGDNVPLALSPTEAPSVFFKVAMLIGVVLAMPVIVYEVFQFVRPGLLEQEKRYVLIGAPVASLAFGGGVAFAAVVLVPSSLPFLQGFLAGIVEQRYSIDLYMSFVTNIMLWAGLVFETPLLMFFLAKLGVVAPESYAGARRVVVVAAAAGAAIITPTVDPVNMLLIMLPFIVLYEVGILLAKLAAR